jgi:AcrR family transcriptional regulator
MTNTSTHTTKNGAHHDRADDAPDQTDGGSARDSGEDEGDGRSQRRRRNRDAVIAALISLIREGDLDPSVAKIADRAEVSHRSIFRYFDDLNDLARTAVETEFRNVVPSTVVPDIGQGTLDHRINVFIDIHIRTLLRTHSLGLVARSRSLVIPEIDRSLAAIIEYRVEQTRRQFAPELGAMPEHERETTAMAISTFVSFETFDMQRRRLGSSIDEITEVWHHGLRKLLA